MKEEVIPKYILTKESQKSKDWENRLVEFDNYYGINRNKKGDLVLAGEPVLITKEQWNEYHKTKTNNN